jgi:hypothetical protein
MIEMLKQTLVLQASPFMVTPFTLTLCLAYIHHYTPLFLPGRWFSPSHLRRLARWIGLPRPYLRSVRAHPGLAAHLALLRGAGLITATQDAFMLSPSTGAWLHASAGEQLEPFLTLLHDSALWEQVVTDLGLQDTLHCDFTAYIQQTLWRQREAGVTPSAAQAYWMEETVEEAWRLCLPASLPPWLLFDLLQLGEWEPGEPLCCTPLSIVAASRRGYGAHHVRWLLETATQKPLPRRYEEELREWLKRGRIYQARHVHLLTTAQPGQMQELLAQRRWRPYFYQQISSRHTIVSADLLPHLRAWLAKKGCALDDTVTIPGATLADTTAHSWLGLRVLVGLGELIPLTLPLPYAQLESLAEQLTALQRSELEFMAQSILENVRAAMRGWDAFWPAQNPVPTGWLSQIERAIEGEQHLDIVYQSLAEFKPAYRRIQPLRLEQRGALHYLHAYCYRTEMNLVFRVDRIKEILTR